MSPSKKSVMSGARAIVLLAALSALGACASAPLETSDLGKTFATAQGNVLVGSTGDTLYTYDKDAPDQSNCTGACAAIWPPAAAGRDSQPKGDFSIFTRPSGSRQWAYKGKPLYTYTFDGGTGSISGDGVDGTWHAARP
jgi:predicted lipoprotein with Yx(FWY)xxD motif